MLSKHELEMIQEVFDLLPKPQLEPQFDFYGIINQEGQILRMLTNAGIYRDAWIMFITAKALNVNPRLRKCLSIEFSSDELSINPKLAITNKLTIGTSRFHELAEFVEEGGYFPKTSPELSIHSS